MPVAATTATIEADFRHAMEAAGIATQADIVADGKLHRFDVEGDKRGSKSGWYVLHPDPWVGVFGCYKRNINEKWRPESPGMSEEERKLQNRRIADALSPAHDAVCDVLHLLEGGGA